MSTVQPVNNALVDRALLAKYEPVLQFPAPYLIEKLVKDRLVDTPEEGEALFIEAKKFLILSFIDVGVSWDMYSTRIDETWHKFVLFTRQYADFCHRYFGRYLHHNPDNAPGPPGDEPSMPSTFQQFRVRYEAFFGEPLPDVWLDECSVSLSRRVINHNAGESRVTVDAGLACLSSAGGRTDVVVDDIARDALEFISCTATFYVRELPGSLTDEEKVGLAATLVEHRILRVAP